MMSKVKFILGRTGTGKTYQILTEIKEKCRDQPTGNPIFIITPEQMTFHTEYQLLRMNEKNSMIRANALSFNRLAHRIMQEVGGLSRYHLDEVGKAMLLQKIMLEKGDELGIFKNYIKKPNFIGKMDELFSEFKSYQLETAELKTKLMMADLSRQTKEKISTLASLYDEFNETTLKQYLTTEDYFTLLIETIEKSNLIKNADIYIDGYHTFNPQELAIINKLAHHSQQLTIVLTTDIASRFPLWQTTRQTYDQLQESLAEFKPTTHPILSENKEVSKRDGLIHLEQNFMQKGLAAKQSTVDVNLFLAPTRRQEIEEIAKRIHYLSHHKQISYANIAIYAPNPTEDQRLYEAIFTKYNMPYFFDYKESMLSHPVINLLHKTFNIFTSYWKNDAIFDVLKTGLFLTGIFTKESAYETHLVRHLEDIDQLENYVLARNIKKHHWISGAIWSYGNPDEMRKTDKQKETQEQINAIKDQVVKPLLDFELALEKAKTPIAFATAVFEYLETLEIPMKLQLLAKTAEKYGTQKEMKQHEQVWGKVLSLLEQIVEVASEDEALETEYLIQMFKTGLEQLSYASIPATLDAVQIGDITRSRYQLTPDFNQPEKYGMQYVFMMGANDGALPATPTESSLISESERQILENLGIQLAPSLIQTQQDEIFSIYTLLAGARIAITLSCLIEHDARPSYLLTHIQSLFPENKIQILLDETKKYLPHGESNASYQEVFSQQVVDLKEEDAIYDLSAIRELFHDKQLKGQIIIENDLYERLTTPEVMFDQIFLNVKRDDHQLAYYQPMLDYYQKTNLLQHDKAKLALGYNNQTVKLSEKLSLDLYTTDIEASISRIELFNKCEFAHFMNHGLKLKARDLFELTVTNIGNLYHEALRYISEEMKTRNRSFSSLNESEIKQLSTSSVEKAISRNREFEILNTSTRMHAIKYKLTTVVTKTLEALANQGQKSAFKESYFELKFKRQLDEERDRFVKEWIQTTPRKIGDVNLSLRGVIDRVDIGVLDDQTYVRVVDYKSSARELEIDAIYHGQSLQLLTYLDVALEWIGKEAREAGALYFHLHSPYAKINEELLTKEASDYQRIIADEQLANYRMTGYLPDNHEVVALSDSLLAEGRITKSTVVPITYKKDRTFAQKGNKILKPEDFDLLRQFANQKIETAVAHMITGGLAINPALHDGKSPCDWCNYKAICQFDVKKQPEGSRKLTSMKPDVALEKIKETLIEQHQENEVMIHGN